MQLAEPHTISITLREYGSLEDSMRRTVHKGGTSAAEHFGIKADGTIQMGADLGRYDYVSKKMEDRVSISLLGGTVTDSQLDSLSPLLQVIRSIYPSAQLIATKIPQVKERYGRHPAE